MDAKTQNLKEQFRAVGKVLKPSTLLIIMAEIYNEQGKKETKKLFDELASKVSILPENK